MTPESNQKRAKRPWSRGDKLLMIVPCLLTVLAFGLFSWFRTLDKTPVFTLPPPTVMPAVNARDYFLKAAAVAKQTGSVGPDSQAVRLLHQGFQYPYQEPPPAAVVSSMHEINTMRILGEKLSVQARIDARQSRWAASAAAGMDAFQMGVAVTHGADFDGTLFGLISQDDGDRPLWKTVDHLNASQARAGVRRLETIRADRVPYVKMLVEDKASFQRGLSQQMNRPNWRSERVGASSPILTQPKAWADDVVNVTRLQLTDKQQILTANAEYMDALIAAAQKPYASHPVCPPPPDDSVNRIVSDLFDLTNKNMWTDTINLDTQNALLLTAFALRAYHLDHGTYPAVLSSLVPDYLAAVPNDPFALSGPLRYKRVGAKYLLYSVGPDAKDDGGRAIYDPTRAAPTSNDDARHGVATGSTGDAVAGVNI